ncbi:hypothetical protein EV697_1173 [Bisgaardia hudsonensis]|uniref:Uncharacterized protein n=1 Tax=Bisgaardia hudsonensis TaxID=109472 RepID=A0A4R2MZR6_9PAST|nr:hypothetical protein [Bisgaardia hudsonensis]QLB12856.1 hypothetical protein A6A11_04160 [Bisgaardia hudsonensis]TCP10716.1 hypothetical protein EV697_1173 [Bisgaardia hudsonensis]
MKFVNEQELYTHFEMVYYDMNDIPYESLSLTELDKEFDGYNFFQYGNLFEYIIASFKETQPLSYEYLMQGRFFYAVKKSTHPLPIMGDITELGILVNDRAYFIYYTPYAKNHKKYSNIPLEILSSWLYRSKRWGIMEKTTHNVYKSTLPSTILTPMRSIIAGFEDKKGYALPEYVDFLETKFNQLFRQRYGDKKYFDEEKYFELRCLLDTRPNESWDKSGFQLFVSSHQGNERNVYVVPQADVFKIKKLSNPAEAIDNYAAHLFAKKEGEFDFMQYAEDF